MERIDLFRAYFFDETKYYVDKLEKYEIGIKHTFNFYAGLFGVSWFLYRKMYKEGLILLLCSFITNHLVSLIIHLFSSDMAVNVWIWGITILTLNFGVVGFLGNKIYLKKATKIVNEFESKYEIADIPNSSLNELRLKGCPSYQPIVIYVGFMILIGIIANLLG